jgi:uncharacterized protein YndB with AHSA1/START domain
MDHEVTSEIVLESGPEAVWDALTDPERLSDWLGGEVEMDPRPGGDLTVRDTHGGTGGDDCRTGFVEEADPGRRLSFWWSRGDEEATRVELELEELAEGTVVRVTESRPLVAIDAQAAELVRQAGGGTGPQMTALARA